MADTQIILVEYKCYNCRRQISIDLEDIQKERMSVGMDPIRLKPSNPHRYYLRCPHCSKFNQVRL